mgnify:FL=1
MYKSMYIFTNRCLQPTFASGFMTASLFLLGLAWTLPLGLLGWSYYHHRQPADQRVTCRTVVETVAVDVHSDVWMVTSSDDTRSASAPAEATYHATLPKAQAVVRIQTPEGAPVYRRCEPFLN